MTSSVWQTARHLIRSDEPWTQATTPNYTPACGCTDRRGPPPGDGSGSARARGPGCTVRLLPCYRRGSDGTGLGPSPGAALAGRRTADAYRTPTKRNPADGRRDRGGAGDPIGRPRGPPDPPP